MKTMRNRARLQLAITFGLLVGLASRSVFAQEAINQVSYEGTLGTTHIGLTLLVKEPGTIAGGHYFYAKYLKDIPITGSMPSSSVTLQGQDGGIFALRFKGNGSEGGKPLDFQNSVGLEGTWSKDAKSLPVTLGMITISSLSKSGRWYESVTDQSDAAFEATAQGFYKAALAGDKQAAARYVSFPLRVNRNGKSRTIHSAAELAAQWETIVTPAYLAMLRKDTPHDMGVSNGMAMLGSGEVWFSDKGATSLNLP